MAWHAKPSGAYPIDSSEAQENVLEIWSQLSTTWTKEAVAGLCGNIVSESGLNPWRWQSDIVNLSDPYKGYGLVQFTPASGYVNQYGPGTPGFAPNLSTTSVQGGNVSDASAQLIVVDNDKAGKYLNRTSYCKYLDISSAYPVSNYKKLTDVYLATVAWLFDYEFPADRSESVAQARYANALKCYAIIGGTPPTPAVYNKSMPLWMMMKWRRL